MTERAHTTHEVLTDPFELKDIGAYADSLTGEVKTWLEAQRDYHILVASERAAELSTGFLGGSILCSLLACALAFLSIAGAIWIGRSMGDPALGFLVISGTYLLLGLIFIPLWRRRYRDLTTLRLFNALYHG